MNTPRPIRILSDLHLGHPASLIKEVGQLGALLEGAGTVVFNGDTVERQGEGMRAMADRRLEELKDFCDQRGIETVFVNGNHDPDISEVDHIDLLGGRVLVTHGHALFPGIAPWGRDALQLAANYRRALRRTGNERGRKLEHRLAAATKACAWTSYAEISPSGFHWLGRALTELAHPVRSFEMIRAWWETPGRAAALADRFRPHATCVVLGHTHLPGAWIRGHRCIMNTGAYLPWLGRRMIDVTPEQVLLRKVVRTRTEFRPGQTLTAWSLIPSAVPERFSGERVADY